MKKAAYPFLAVAVIAQVTAPAHAQSVYPTPYTFTTLAGVAGEAGFANGTGAAAQFSFPSGIAVDGTGNLYVSDSGNNVIRKVTPSGVVTTLAGTAGASGSTDGTGAAVRFNVPDGIALDASGNVYIADTVNNTVRKMTPSGVVTTLAGTAGVSGSNDGTGAAAQFNGPFGIAVDGSGNVYVSDRNNCTIRKITPSGAVTTWAGTAGVQNFYDGTGVAAAFFDPAGIAIDTSGNLYVDDQTEMIRKITPAAVVTTLAGLPPIVQGTSIGANQGSIDGTGRAAGFNNPTGIAVDGNGNLYVADTNNETIRKITPSAVVTTLAGAPGVSGSADGTGAAARFFNPYAVAVDGSGNLYVVDASNCTIRKGTLSAGPLVQTQPSDQYVAAGASATFSVIASGSSTVSYQWKCNCSAIPGATGSSYTITSVQSSNAGPYTVTVTDTDGPATSNVANLYVDSGSSGARLVNISTRAQVGTGGSIMIPGLAVGGSGTETLLIRADGPALTQFGVAGALAQPSLTVLSGQTVVASNTGWGTNPSPSQIGSVAAQVGAFPLVSGSADCALIVSLPPGSYTVQVSGVGNTTGVALAEVYEVSSSGTRLSNISTRAQVGTGGNILIPGFVIAGSGYEQLLVRGDGPSLTQFGVTGVLAQPSLSVLNSAGTVVASNTGWGTGSDPSQIASIASEVGAFSLTSGSADSAQVVNLAAGAYTIQISGVSNTIGVALAEVYEVPTPTP